MTASSVSRACSYLEFVIRKRDFGVGSVWEISGHRCVKTRHVVAVLALFLNTSTMARAHRFAGVALLVAAAYILVVLQYLSVPLVDEDIAQQIIPLLPWWLLVSFGSYSLWSLGWGLWTFRDCPEAYTELMVEITEAKDALRTQGVTVD